jgi:hypothetical protein
MQRSLVGSENVYKRQIYEGPIESFLLNNINANEAANRIIQRFNTELARIMED